MKSIIILLFAISSCLCEVEFSARSRNFSIELLHFTQLDTDGHVVISPFGIWTLMTGVAIGATGNSFRELSTAFILPRNYNNLIQGYQALTAKVLNPETKGVSLTSSNFLFLDDDFSIFPEFRSTVTNDFGASINVFNFDDTDTAAKIANDLIQSARSGGRVSNVLKSSDFAESKMVLTNVMSFKGLWALPFNKSDTTRQPFYNENKEAIGDVNMMYQKSQIPYSSIKEIKSSVIELPYGNDNKYSMLIILPYNNVKVSDVYKNFTIFSLKDIFKRLQDDIDEFDLSDVEIQLPRFKISTNVVLNKPLNNMGVYDIFEPDVARFEKVTKEKIFVSAIVHKADIEVTETGTVASAVTSAHFADRITPPRLHANKPFIYFVMEKPTTTVIFGGIYSKPTAY